MLTVRTSENTVITSFRLISERQDFSSVRTGENTVRARARIHKIICSLTLASTFTVNPGPRKLRKLCKMLDSSQWPLET